MKMKQLIAAAAIAGLAGFGATANAGETATAGTNAQVTYVVQQILFCTPSLSGDPNQQRNCEVIPSPVPVVPPTPLGLLGKLVVAA